MSSRQGARALLVVKKHLDHRTLYETWAQGIHVNAVLCVVDRHLLGHADYGMFGR